MRGHCTTHVLRDRQLAANHRANHPSRLFFRKYKNRAIKERRSYRLIPLPRFRFASRTRVLFPAEIRRLPSRAPSGKLAQRTETLRGAPTDLLMASFFSPFQNTLYTVPVFVLYLPWLCKWARVAANTGRWLAVASWTRCLAVVFRPEDLIRKIMRTQAYDQRHIWQQRRKRNCSQGFCIRWGLCRYIITILRHWSNVFFIRFWVSRQRDARKKIKSLVCF